MGLDFIIFMNRLGIEINLSPGYDPEIKGVMEQLVQKKWMRARVLIFNSSLPTELRGEAIVHANSLRNRRPSNRIRGDVPILR